MKKDEDASKPTIHISDIAFGSFPKPSKTKRRENPGEGAGTMNPTHPPTPLPFIIRL